MSDMPEHKFKMKFKFDSLEIANRISEREQTTLTKAAKIYSDSKNELKSIVIMENNIQNGLTFEDCGALNKFIEKYPTWWWTIGYCDLSRDFSCAPQSHSPEMQRDDATQGSVWDEGFHCDHSGTIADAIYDVMKQIEEYK